MLLTNTSEHGFSHQHLNMCLRLCGGRYLSHITCHTSVCVCVCVCVIYDIYIQMQYGHT